METVEAVRSELLSEKELAEKSQKEMEADLIKTKHRYSNSIPVACLIVPEFTISVYGSSCN